VSQRSLDSCDIRSDALVAVCESSFDVSKSTCDVSASGVAPQHLTLRSKPRRAKRAFPRLYILLVKYTANDKNIPSAIYRPAGDG